MSASEVTDFERGFRYFAIWLHGQVFSKLLLGLFFQCQKSAWTYFKKLKTASTHHGKNKAEFGARLNCKYMFVSVHLSTRSCISLDLPEGKPSLPTHLHPSQPHLAHAVLLSSCFPKALVKPQLQCDCPAQPHCPWLGGWAGGGLGNYREALESHAGQAWEMTVYLAQAQPLWTAASSPGGSTVSGFSLRC